ncbi:MAG TPA: 2'-5' RNA ligase family protein [Bryobacteraceae bacterium]|nr:2'-5' RNA ligase family protein [Bryobacteraceae bacterium]
MGSSNSNGMPQAGQDRSLFALVIYIPDPLGRFLDDLRRELVPGCNPHAHVSVLPPRPLSVDVRSACEQARLIAEEFHPFDVEAGEIEIFPTTNVVYINLARGSEELRGMHRTMNRDGLGFQEPFSYHPHITLAQEISPAQVPQLVELAKRRWREFPGSRIFRAEHAVFVQNSGDNQWVDLANISLGAVSVPR